MSAPTPQQLARTLSRTKRAFLDGELGWAEFSRCQQRLWRYAQRDRGTEFALLFARVLAHTGRG